MSFFSKIFEPDVQKLKAKGRVKGLIKALRYKKDMQVQISAVEALGTIRDPRAFDALVDALLVDEREIRQTASKVLGRIGDLQAVDPLIDALEKKREAWTATALGTIGDPRAIDALIGVLMDENKETRRAAAEALEKIGDPRAIDPLANALRQKREVWAAEALKAFGDPRMVDAFIDALLAEDSETRRAAAEALGMIGDSRAVDPLISALKRKGDAAAAEALGKFEAPRAVDPLIDALTKKRDTARAAAEALGMIADPRAVEALVAVFKPWEHYNEGEENDLRVVRAAAGDALSKMGPPAVEPLIGILKCEVERAKVADWKALRGTSFVARAELFRAAQVHSLVIHALKQITGNYFGENTTRWLQWWDEQH